jgi:PKD repeat protein
MLLRQSTMLGALALVGTIAATATFAANIVPNDIKMPGTQPEDGIVSLDDVAVCANCHGNYDPNAEPLHNWRGSMMAHSSRDPIFWATLAVAEQDFNGAGDLCIRCHTPAGWLDGRSAPTNGSALDINADRNGIQCDLCHRLTNPDQSEHAGVQIDPFFAFSGDPLEGHYGSAQYVVTDSNATKLGPYADANPPAGAHAALQSQYHRSPELCGPCHDVSNPVVGGLAHNNGAKLDLNDNNPSVGNPDLALNIPFNYQPYEYGVVERTYSEHKASLLGSTRVADFETLPAELQVTGGAIHRAVEAARAADPTGLGNYADGTERLFTCQTCHLPPVRGKGAGMPAAGRFAPPVRDDLPKHDLTGGNYWMPEAMQWLSSQGRLRFGALTAAEITGMNDGIARAKSNLEAAASLTVDGNTVKVVNLTSHKLISGYPEGRRMWLNIQWLDANGNLIDEEGGYGELQTALDLDGDGADDTVRTLLDLKGTANAPIYDIHGAITGQWALQLVSLNASYRDLVVGFDRVTGAPTMTLADLAALCEQNQEPDGSCPSVYEYSFHFVLNNKVATDGRIPPYGFSYDEAKKRNALPEPETQYGNPGPGGTYEHWDEIALNPPEGAASANIRLLFQPTSWEYVQFLYLANDGTDPEVGMAGQDYLDAWLNTGMAEPHLMATATWEATGPINAPPTASFSAACTELACNFDAGASADTDGTIVSYDWTLGDGATATGVTASHSYAAAGTYTVTLAVTDDGGLTDTATQDVTVSTGNVAPTASFTFACTDLACSFDASASTDTDGTIASYAWNFGDGTTATGVTAIHTYVAAGTYTVTLTVTDDQGATGVLTQDVTVTDVNTAPTASFTSTCTDLACTFDASASVDTDGTIVSYAWNFGDGATATGVTASHVYGAEGTYTVTLTVTDDGGLTGVATAAVTVTAPGIPGPGPGRPRR